jgi:hypothetical protein
MVATLKQKASNCLLSFLFRDTSSVSYASYTVAAYQFGCPTGPGDGLEIASICAEAMKEVLEYVLSGFRCGTMMYDDANGISTEVPRVEQTSEAASKNGAV